MFRILKLDHTGHTTVETDIQAEFAKLCKQGYAMFVDDVQIKALPDAPQVGTVEILALAPLVGG
jgi:hypothetical protein